MKALLLFDESSEDFQGVNLAEQVRNSIQNAGFAVKSRKIIGSEFKHCMGCFGCWVRTPGLCVLQGDNANEINGDVINAQVLVILTNVLYGCYSPDIKRYLDRIIPDISPFFTVINGETHHQKRYGSYPNFIGIGYGENICSSEQVTFKTLIKRNSINLHAQKNLALVIGSQKEISEKINSLCNFLTEVPA